MGRSRQRGSKHDIPAAAYTIRDYARMQEIARAFALGSVKLLILLGGPGKGKGQIVRKAMQDRLPTSDDQFTEALERSLATILSRLAPDSLPPEPPPSLGPGLYIKGVISPINFHISAYRHVDEPICIDDADAFFADRQLRERTKHLTETDRFKLQVHSTLSKELLAAEVPKEFWTTSPVCIIRNVWDSADPINQAIESRGTFIVFDPTWDEVYRYIGTWFWDQEIYDYLLEMLPLLREPDMRIILKAHSLKIANIPGLPWKTAIDNHIAEPSYRLMAEFLGKDESAFGGREQRIDAWIAAVKSVDSNAPASRAKWHRDKSSVEALMVSTRPQRILLERNSPPIERRPSDSPVGVA